MMNRYVSCNCLVPMSCNICDGMLTETDCPFWLTIWKEEVMVSAVGAEIDAPQSSGTVTFILLKPYGFLTTFFFARPPLFSKFRFPIRASFLLSFNLPH